MQSIYPSVHTDELLNGVWFCQCRHYCKCRTYIYNTFELIHLSSRSLNLNALRSRVDVLRTMLSLISLRQLLKMFVSCFLANNDIFLKYSRDIVFSFFWVILEYRIRLTNNSFKNLWIQLSIRNEGKSFSAKLTSDKQYLHKTL